MTFQIPKTKRIDKRDLPNVPLGVRMKQRWVLVWFESNQILELDNHFNSNYLSSLSGLFDATISYRNDSWVSNHFYSRGVHFKKSLESVIKEDSWKKYEQKVRQKNK